MSRKLARNTISNLKTALAEIEQAVGKARRRLEDAEWVVDSVSQIWERLQLRISQATSYSLHELKNGSPATSDDEDTYWQPPIQLPRPSPRVTETKTYERVEEYHHHHQTTTTTTTTTATEVPCAICQENLNYYDSRTGGGPCMTPCVHHFHFLCIGGWFGQGKTTCPVCREPVTVSKLVHTSIE